MVPFWMKSPQRRCADASDANETSAASAAPAIKARFFMLSILHCPLGRLMNRYLL
jgi:hypothetical protein